jgi:large subunit ribosomal protein L2
LNKVKKLKQGKKSFDKGGRNSQGSITVFHRGGRNKRLYRLIDFKRSLFRESSFSEETVVKKGQDSKISNQNTSSEKTREGIVIKIDYDPNRTAAVAMICYSDGVLSYILCPKDLQVGDKVSSGCVAPINKGNALPIENIPVGTLIHNIEIKPGKGGQLVRAAGAYAKIVKKETKHVVIRFNSGKVYNIPLKCMATIGVVSNELHKNKKLAKAGSKR